MINDLKEQIKKIPPEPGIYLFKNSDNKPLYIGKALNLKNRLKNYLKIEDTRIGKMLSEAKKIDIIETDSDIEALILESQYIKKYKPPFNIVLRDDKQYSSVIFTQEKYPRVFITHQPQGYEDTIGPFTDAGALKTTLKLLRRIFPYCTCKQLHNNYCLNYHIGKCLGFCCLKNYTVSNLEIKIYERDIKAIKDVLTGKKETLIKSLQKEMKNISYRQEYEKAMELQYKIEKIKRVFKNAQIIQRQTTDATMVIKELKKILGLPTLPNRIECYDVANIQGQYAVGSMSVFIGGQPDKNEYRKFKIHTTPKANVPTSQVGTLGRNGGDTGMLKEVLTRRLNHMEWQYPDLIVVDGGKGQLNSAKEVVIKNIPVIALTKNENHVGYKIILENGKGILLSKLPTNIKNLLLHIDSEAHRFAISYYRKLHRDSLK